MSETNSLRLIANRKRRSAAIEASAKLITQKKVCRKNASVIVNQEIGLLTREEEPHATEQDIRNEEDNVNTSQVGEEEQVIEKQDRIQVGENSESTYSGAEGNHEGDKDSSSGNESEASNINGESVDEEDTRSLDSSESHAESNGSNESRSTVDEEDINVGNEEDINRDEDLDISSNELDEEHVPRQRVKKSWVWKYFTKDDDAEKVRCVCGYSLKCNKAKGSTSNMRIHLTNENGIHKLPFDGPENILNKRGPADMQETPPFLTTTFRHFMVKWIITTNKPFDEVSHKEFWDMMKIANPKIQSISRFTIRRDLDIMHMFAQKWVKATLKKVTSKISFTIDCWTTKNTLQPYMGITAHYVDEDGLLKNLCLRLVHLEGPHSGQNLCAAFMEVVDKQFEIFEKISAITTDSAANNSLFVRALIPQLESRNVNIGGPLECHLRCFLHVLNLAVQALLKGLKCDAPINENELLEDDELEQYHAELGNNEGPIKKLRKLISKIRCSSQRRQKFEKACQYERIQVLQLKMDIETRWNSTYHMIERALRMKKAIERFLINSGNDISIRRLALFNCEWNYLRQVLEVLKWFHVTTDCMSTARYPTVQQVLPFFSLLQSRLDGFLECDAEDEPDYEQLKTNGKSEEISKAVQSARNKLAEYYRRTSQNPIYAISTVLDPRFKLAYFSTQLLSEYTVRAVKSIVVRYWQNYKPLGTRQMQNNVTTTDEQPLSSTTVVQLLRSQVRTNLRRTRHYSTSDFVRNATSTNTYVEDELEKYLRQELVDDSVNDVMNWWKDHEKEFPNLSKMAKDYLGIPATTVSIEREFSLTSDTCVPKRSSLTHESLTKSQETKSYFHFGGDAICGYVLNKL